MAECSPMSTLGDGNLTELYVGYAQISYKLKMDLQCCMVGKVLINILQYILCSNYLWTLTSGNRTTGSRCNPLVGQAHPSESCQVLTLTLWIGIQTLIAATSKLALFKICLYLRPIQINIRFTWWPHSSLIAWAHWANITELSSVQTLQLQWDSKKLLYRWISKKLITMVKSKPS